jgi:MSHA pilin protein MshA
MSSGAQEAGPDADLTTLGVRIFRAPQHRQDHLQEHLVDYSEHRGFTLIELVVVITILGILAAFAVPKYIGLDSQSRTATIAGLAGSVSSAATLARGLSMALGSTASVSMEGATVNLVNNYPDSSLTGIAAAVNSSNGASGDFTFTAGGTPSTGPATWTKNGAPTPASCVVNYTPPVAAGSAPTVTTVTTGC